MHPLNTLLRLCSIIHPLMYILSIHFNTPSHTSSYYTTSLKQDNTPAYVHPLNTPEYPLSYVFWHIFSYTSSHTLSPPFLALYYHSYITHYPHPHPPSLSLALCCSCFAVVQQCVGAAATRPGLHATKGTPPPPPIPHLPFCPCKLCTR